MDLSDVQAVLFDMDGTLVDSDAAVERAWVVWAREHDLDVDATLAVAHGAPTEATVRRLRPDLDDAAVAVSSARQLSLQYVDLDDVRATPGAHELLAALARRGLLWGVVTSADVPLTDARLGAAGIAPPMLVTIEEVARGKPEPDGYLLGARRLGVVPGACLVVEDTEVGARAGRAAGARVATLKGVPGDLELRDLGELARAFDQSSVGGSATSPSARQAGYSAP